MNKILTLYFYTQVAALTTSEKVSKGEQLTLQHSVEELQNKLQSALSSRAVDRQTITNLERRIIEERRSRVNCEAQIAQERKNRKQEEARAAQVIIENNFWSYSFFFFTQY